MGDTFTLANGIPVPAIGFGTYETAEGGNEAILSEAVRAGYRYFDTASFYGNEAALGHVLRESGLARYDYFLASKVWKTEMGYDNTLRAFEASLKRLDVEVLDLYLIHWPRPDLSCDWRALDRETWRALEQLYKEGRVRAIGVSNFLPHHLENLMEHASVHPMVNQIEFHPGYSQNITVDFCHTHGILPQAWSPLGRARVLEHPLLLKIARSHGVSPAQVCIRFALQCGVSPLPKASKRNRMEQNLDVFHFSLTEEEMSALLDMPRTGWSGEHPDQERLPPC